MSELRLNTDGHIIKFGADNDVSLTHVADVGLNLKNTATADDKPIVLTLQTGETDMAANDVIGKIAFQAPDEGTGTDAILISAAIQARAEADHSSSSNATSLDFMTGASEAATAKFKVASDGDVLIGNGTNDVLKIDLDSENLTLTNQIQDNDFIIKVNDNGSSIEAIRIKGSDAGQVLFRDGTAALPSIANTGDANTGMYWSGDEIISIVTGGTEVLRLNDSRKLSTGAETAPDCTEGGLTIDQNAQDAAILTFKSSDVAHGITAQEETDTFGKIRKNTGGDGGLFVAGYGEAAEGIFMAAVATTTNAAKSTSGIAPFEVNAQLKDGTGYASGGLGSNINLFCVSSATATKFIVDHEGDIHYDGSDAGAYDTYDDAQLVRAFDLSHGRGVINSKFDKFVSYNHEKLAEMKLVGREEDGTPNHFINTTGMQRLHNGAIWQQYEKHNQLLEAVYELAEKAVGKKEADAILDKHEVKRLN